MNNDLLKNLSYISQDIGKYPSYAQGGGGNTSVKLDKNRMAIKASGYLLSDVTEVSGFSVVDYTAIRLYLESPDEDEDLFVKKIKSLVIETNNRPSIETGFHALLEDYVIHTHSVYVNILTCSRDGKRTTEELFPDSLWVAYATPGKDLTLLIRNLIEQTTQKPKIIFLQNHGVIVSAQDANEALQIHEDLNKRIQVFLGITEDAFASWGSIKDLDYVKEHVLFPDQVVYTFAGEDILKSQAAEQTLLAYSFILKIMEEKGLLPNFIDKKYADILLNMESEKYRQNIMLENKDL